MNWLAKINLNTVVQKIGVFRSSLLLVLLIITCVFCGYRMGNYFHGYQSQALADHKKRLERLYHQQDSQIKRINTLEVELEVERMANLRSLNLLRDVETDHYQLKKELAFYEKVMAPEKEIDGVLLDDFILTATDIEGKYNFKTVLVQQLKKKRYSKGVIDIVVTGSQNDKKVKLGIKELSSLTPEELSFNFKFFQSILGSFTIPNGFIPEKINIIITLPKSRWQKYQRFEESFEWQDKLGRLKKAIPVILD